jgi:hypothetical protein
MKVDRVVRAYGNRVIEGLPNGAIFAIGDSEELDTGDIGIKEDTFATHLRLDTCGGDLEESLNDEF